MRAPPEIAAGVGSFWLENVSPKGATQVQALLSALLEGCGYDEAGFACALSANPTQAETGAKGYRFSSEDVVYVEAAAGDAPVDLPYPEPGGVFSRESLGIADGEAAWVVRLRQQAEILGMFHKGEVVEPGSVFRSVPGAAVFSDDPGMLFPSYVIPAASMRMTPPSLLRDLHDAPRLRPGGGVWLSQYRGGGCSGKVFLRAAAEFARYYVAEDGFPVVSVTRSGAGYTYGTFEGEVHVPYLHTPLSVGDAVQAGDIIGMSGTFYSLDGHELSGASGNWWDAAPFPATLPLDPCCVLGQSCGTGETLVLAADAEGHTQLASSGSTAYGLLNTLIEFAEENHGVKLWSLLGAYPQNQATDPANALSFFMEHFLGNCSALVELSGGVPELDAAVAEFIADERPASRIVFTTGAVA